MKRRNLRRNVLWIPLILVSGPALGASGPSAPPSRGESGSQVPRETTIEEIQAIGVDRTTTTFAGTVLDVSDHPLAGVQVRVFVDGHAVGSAVTEGDGFYEIKAHYDPSEDATVMLWLVPPERSLMTKAIVLQESRSCRSNGLISPCIARATITPGRQFRVYLFDAANRNKELAELNCLP